MRQTLAPHLAKEEKRENGQDNAECCQSQTVKTNSVGVGFPFSLITISPNITGHIRVCDMRERVRHLEDGDE